MTQTQYDDLLNIPFDQLIDRFVKKYYEFYGTLKMEDIFFEIDNSTKIQNYIKSRTADTPPKAAEIFNLLRSNSYFFFSRAGSRCVAALIVLLSWEDKYNRHDLILDANDLIKLCADIISLTLNKTLLIDKKVFDSFFHEIATGENDLANYQLA